MVKKTDSFATTKDLENKINELAGQINDMMPEIVALEKKNAKNAKIWKYGIRATAVALGLMLTVLGGGVAYNFAMLGSDALAVVAAVTGLVAPFCAYKVGKSFDESIDLPGRRLIEAKLKLKELVKEKRSLMDISKWRVVSLTVSKEKELLDKRERGLKLLKQLEKAQNVEQVKKLLDTQSGLEESVKKFLLKIAMLNLQKKGTALQEQISMTEEEVKQSQEEVVSVQQWRIFRAKLQAEEMKKAKERKLAAYLEKKQKQQ